MGMDARGKLCYGLLLEEDQYYPWNSEEDPYADVEDWWMYETGYKPLLEDPYGPNYEEYKRNGEWAKYFDHRMKWKKEHPFPLALINVQSGDYPVYILSIPESVVSCYMGEPRAFDFKDLENVITKEKIDQILDFVKKYDIVYKNEPSWYLGSEIDY